MASKIVSLILQAKNKLSPSIDEATKSLDGMSSRASELERELAKLEGAQTAIDSLDRVRESATDAEKAFDKAALEVIELKKAFKTEKTPELEIALDKAKVASRNAKKEWQASAKTLEQLEKRLGSAGIEFDNFEKSQRELADLASKYKAALVAEKTEVEKLSRAQAEAAQIVARNKHLQAKAYEEAHEEAFKFNDQVDKERKQQSAAEKASRGHAEALQKQAFEQHKAEQASREQAEALQKQAFEQHKAEKSAEELAKANKKVGDSAKTSGKGIKSFIASAAGLIGVTLLLGKIRDGFSSLATAVFKTGDEFELLSKRLNSEELKFIEEFARNTPLQLSGVADAFIRLRAFGVDPTLGAMQALTDQNAALGGGQAELEGIINAVGQAWAKQKLQGEEILQLVERGVPAWDLLAKATGKNTRELSKMSEQGKLGRKEIRLLIEEIAKANEGEAAKAMSTLGGIVSNLNDDFTMFYRKVADYGALDKLKEAFAGVREQIAGMADDGRLDKLAEATSNYFSTVIQWSKESASSLNTNFGAIYGSAKIVSNSIAIVFDGLKASVAGAGVVIASVLELISSFGGFDEFSKKAGIAADAFKTQFEKAGDSIRENFGDIKNGAELLPQSFDQITTSINKTAAANKEQGDAANAAGEASKKAGEDSKKASDEAAEAARRQAEAQVEALDALGRLGIEQAQLTNEVTTGVAQSIQDLQSLDSQLSEIGKGANNSSIFFDAIKKSISGIKTEADELALSKSIDDFRSKGQLTFDQYSQLKDKIKDAGDTGEQSGDQMADGVEKVGESAEQAGEKVKKVAADAKDTERNVRAVAGGLAEFFNGIKNDVYALSDAAGAAFSDKLGIEVQPILDDIESLRAGINAAHVEMGTLARDNLKVFDVTGINRFENSVLAAQNSVEIAYSEQKIKFLEYLDVIKSGEGINESFLNSAESSINNMSLLGQEDLSQLRNALDSANQKLQQMNDNAQNTLEGLQNELDSLQGNQDAIEQRDYNRKREELNAAIEDAKLYGNKEAIASYTEALQVLDQVRRERSNQSRESERAAKNSSRSTSNRSSQSNSSSTTINLRSPEGNKSVTLNGDQKAVDGLLDLLNDYGMRSQ